MVLSLPRILSGWAVVFVYAVVFNKHKNATPGKMLFGLKIIPVAADRLDLSWTQVVLRRATEMLLGLPFSLAPQAVAFFRPDRRQLADLVAGTRVVQGSSRGKDAKPRWILGSLCIIYFGLTGISKFLMTARNITPDGLRITRSMRALTPASRTGTSYHSPAEGDPTVPGVSIRHNLDAAKDMGEAAELSRKACDAGSGESCFDLGVMYTKGLGVSKDMEKAMDFYRKACDMKIGQGCFNLGVKHAIGPGTPEDRREARELFLKACDLGEGRSCINLGNLHEQGQGVPKDIEKALVFYRKACDLGMAEGCDKTKLLSGRQTSGLTNRPDNRESSTDEMNCPMGMKAVATGSAFQPWKCVSE